MAHKKNTTNLTELLLQCVTQPDPMLSMLEWLCTHLMEAEVDQQLGAEKSQRTDGRSGYRSGYRPRRLDTRMGTMVDSSHLVSIAFKRASKYSSWLQV